MSQRIVILDNYDSFTYNLMHYVEQIANCAVDVFRNDVIATDQLHQYDKIILSPGPGLPKDAGIMPEVIKTFCHSKKILGVCLGHQAIAEAFGCSLKNLSTVVHGLATPIEVVNNHHLFNSLPKKLLVGRYHSWVVNEATLPADLEVTARDEHGNIMAIRHRSLSIDGVQFHPESILTQDGMLMIRNWLEH